MSNSIPNTYKAMLFKGQSTGLTDVFKIILMQPGFVFDKDNHKSYNDVYAYELPTANGYTVCGQTLTGVSIIVNNTDDRAEMSWNNAQWNATGGSLSTSGAIIYNDSTATTGDDFTDALVSYKDFGGTITAVDGTPITVSGIKETLT